MVAVASVVSLAAVAVPVGLGTAPPAGAVAAPRTVPAAALPGGAIDTGSVDPSTSLHLSVALDPRDVAALDAFVADVSTPGSPSYGRYLPPGEFGARFGADPATVKDVTAQLRAEGLQPGAPDPNMLSIPVEATAGQATAAFGTRFAHTRLADGGVVTRHTAPAVVPRGAAGILGLDSWPRSHKALPAALAESSAVAATTCTAASSMAGVWSPAQLAAAYGMSSLGATTTGGAGQTVALYELSDYLDSDVAAFQNCYGVHPNVTRVNVDGGTADTSGAGEVMLDADIVMGQVPNAQILVYVAPNSDAGAIDEYRTIVNEDRAQVISISWGLCETYQGSSGARAENNLFKQAAAQGQSIFAASGDDGSADCYGIDGTTTLAVDDPASQPYVTGVGGTTLSSTVPRREAVWNAGGYGGGGGVSQLWSMPTYQAGVRLAGSAACGAAGCRQVPDVAASADPAHGYPVYCSVRTACGRGGWMAFGGTSGAAPLWASAAVLVNEACGPQRRLGFANPALYSAASALNDTDAGNNDAVGGNGGAFSAGSGYDLATGLGTPNVAALAAALCGTAPIATLPPIAVDTGTGAGPSDPAPVVTVPTRSGYWMLAADGRVFPFGDAAWYGDAVSGIAPQMAAGVRAAKLEPTGTFAGYWIVDSAGHVYAFGDAASLGQAATGQLAAGERVTSLSRTPTGRGYWLFTTRGRVLPFGDAAFYGDMSAAVLNGPVLGSIATTSGHGYYMVASDGGIFAFGDARFQGSMGAARLNAAVQSLVPTADGAGYWLVASDGGIFAFGDAPFRGAMGGQRLNAPVSGMVRFADGYLMVAADGGIFDFSDKAFVGSLGGSSLGQPVVAVGALNG